MCSELSHMGVFFPRDIRDSVTITAAPGILRHGGFVTGVTGVTSKNPHPGHESPGGAVVLLG